MNDFFKEMKLTFKDVRHMMVYRQWRDRDRKTDGEDLCNVFVNLVQTMKRD